MIGRRRKREALRMEVELCAPYLDAALAEAGDRCGVTASKVDDFWTFRPDPDVPPGHVRSAYGLTIKLPARGSAA